MKTYLVVWWDFREMRWNVEVAYAKHARRAKVDVWARAVGYPPEFVAWSKSTKCRAILISDAGERAQVKL